MKLKYNFVINQVAGTQVAVAVGEDLPRFNGVIKMNETGAFIFNLLKEDSTEEDIIQALKKEYPDTDEQELKSAAESFIAKLKEADVLL